MIQAAGHYLFKCEIKERKDVSTTMGMGEETNDYEYANLAKEILDRIEAF